MGIPRGQGKMGLIPAVIFFCFLISGLSSLIYEVLWMRMLILIFGSTTFAVSTVLTAFMGGLALGSYLFGRMIDGR
jgi:spermidine synthase